MTASEFKKLQAHWDRRLAAETDFRDLESSNRDAPLSNRGKLHAVTEDEGGTKSLAERIEGGAAYTRWAFDVLHRLPAKGRNYQHRAIWQLHAEGLSLDAIGERFGLNYHVIRGVVNKIEERHKECAKKEPKRADARRAATRKLFRQVSTPALFQLAAVMLKTFQASSPSRSAA